MGWSKINNRVHEILSNFWEAVCADIQVLAGYVELIFVLRPFPRVPVRLPSFSILVPKTKTPMHKILLKDFTSRRFIFVRRSNLLKCLPSSNVVDCWSFFPWYLLQYVYILAQTQTRIIVTLCWQSSCRTPTPLSLPFRKT